MKSPTTSGESNVLRKRHKSSTTSPLKTKFLKLQMRLMERALKPLAVSFDLTKPEGLIAFNKRLIELVLEKKLDARDLGPINGAIANVIRILQPPQGVNVTVTQQVAGLDYSKLVNSLPEDEQIVLAKAIRDLESKAQPSSP